MDVVFDTDEAVRPDTSLEKLSNLKPAFKEGGTITAGNAPSLNAGASMMILSTETGFSEMMRDIYFHKQRRPKPGRFGFQGAAC